jgi:hypothetical protein
VRGDLGRVDPMRAAGQYQQGIAFGRAKISELAMAPTSTPTCAAAIAAVGAGSGRIRTRPGRPAWASKPLMSSQFG